MLYLQWDKSTSQIFIRSTLNATDVAELQLVFSHPSESCLFVITTPLPGTY